MIINPDDKKFALVLAALAFCAKNLDAFNAEKVKPDAEPVTIEEFNKLQAAIQKDFAIMSLLNY